MAGLRRREAIATLCLVQFVDVLGVTELISALPRVLVSLRAPAGWASLILTSYAMCFGGLLMLGARLGDRVGQRRALLGGVAGFAVASLVAATAPSALALVVGRSFQGVSAAISVPAALRLLATATRDPADRNRALSAWSAAGAAAGASGFVLGGAMTEVADWRAMFWINLPLAALIARGVLRSVAGERIAVERHLDAAGAFLFTAAVMSLVLGCSLLQNAGSGLGAGALATAAVLATALIAVERRARDPLIPFAVLQAGRLRTGAWFSFLNTATTSSAVAIATLELQRVDGLTPGGAGLKLLPFSFCVVAGASVASAALRRISREAAISAGLAIICVGDAMLATLPAMTWLVPAAVGVSGLGIGLSSVAATAIGTDVPAADRTAAAGILNTAAQLGSALGVAALLLLSTSSAPAVVPIHGPRLGWAAAALVAIGGAAAAARRNAPDGRADRSRHALCDGRRA